MLRSLALGQALLDSGPITAHSAVTDTAGTIWLALARADDTLRLLTSHDQGQTWTQQQWLYAGARFRQVKLLAPLAGPVALLAFVLVAAGDGDLWLWRVPADTGSSLLPVVVGPDTIDDFAVALDQTPNYYTYCVYVNEHRAGRTGGFIRSSDQGQTWSPETDFWNAHDPQLLATNRSMVHAAWRFAIGGTQIHYAYNRHFGTPRYWSTVRILTDCRYRHSSPLLAQADTGGGYWSAVWAFSTVYRYDTLSREIEYAWSPSNGDWWFTGKALGNSFVEQWPVSLASDPTGPGGFIGLLYLSGGILSLESLQLYWRSANIYSPEFWTPPVRVASSPVIPEPAPQLCYVRFGDWRGPVVFYCTADSALNIGAGWLPPTSDTSRLLPIVANHVNAQTNAAVLYDALGRRVNPQALRPGIYFYRPATGPSRRILLRP